MCTAICSGVVDSLLAVCATATVMVGAVSSSVASRPGPASEGCSSVSGSTTASVTLPPVGSNRPRHTATVRRHEKPLTSPSALEEYKKLVADDVHHCVWSGSRPGCQSPSGLKQQRERCSAHRPARRGRLSSCAASSAHCSERPAAPAPRSGRRSHPCSRRRSAPSAAASVRGLPSSPGMAAHPRTAGSSTWRRSGSGQTNRQAGVGGGDGCCTHVNPPSSLSAVRRQCGTAGSSHGIAVSTLSS